jgi:nitrogenase molybdenum-cofactor synthesis protein NifE
VLENMAPRDMYAFLKEGKADIMLSGGRTQFIALKARTPWLDINQERHDPYAGYDGMVELVKKLDATINNPVWSKVRIPAPWDETGAPAAQDPAIDPSHVARFRKAFADREAQDFEEC